MAKRLKDIQTPAGHWSMSLLAQDVYLTPETSGTFLFTFGLAWGINNGLLKENKYEPVVKKGWDALCSHVTKEGMLGYVQPIGAAPGKAWPDKTGVYGTGSWLLGPRYLSYTWENKAKIAGQPKRCRVDLLNTIATHIAQLGLL